MNLAHELAKIAANRLESDPARSLNKDEIEQLVATGAITPPELIPGERCYSRVSVPESRPRSSYQQKVYR